MKLMLAVVCFKADVSKFGLWMLEVDGLLVEALGTVGRVQSRLGGGWFGSRVAGFGVVALRGRELRAGEREISGVWVYLSS